MTDPVRDEEYKRLAESTVTLSGGKYIACGGKTEILGGDWSPSRLVILQFDSRVRAEDLA